MSGSRPTSEAVGSARASATVRLPVAQPSSNTVAGAPAAACATRRARKVRSRIVSATASVVAIGGWKTVCVEQDQRARGVDERVLEARARTEARPLAQDGLRRLVARALVDRAPLDVLPEAERRGTPRGQQLVVRLQGLRRRDGGRLRVPVLVSGGVGGRSHQGVQDRLARLRHLDRERLRAAAALEDAHVEPHGREGRRAEEVAVAARRLLDLGDRARGAQRDRRETAAVPAPTPPKPHVRAT